LEGVYQGGQKIIFGGQGGLGSTGPEQHLVDMGQLPALSSRLWQLRHQQFTQRILAHNIQLIQPDLNRPRSTPLHRDHRVLKLDTFPIKRVDRKGLALIFSKS
jgi:hypothetical protein